MNLVRENNYLTPPCKANSSAKTPAATPTGMDCGTRWRGRARLRAGDYTGCRMKVMIALGGHWYLTNLPCSQTRMNFSRSWRLRTTTAILPSELRAAGGGGGGEGGGGGGVGGGRGGGGGEGGGGGVGGGGVLFGVVVGGGGGGGG